MEMWFPATFFYDAILLCGRNYSKFGFGTVRDKDLQEKQALKLIIS